MIISGRNAVVIGGATGIGSGICRALVARGARVHLCDIDAEGAEALAGELGTDHVTVHRCDVTDPASLAAARETIAAAGDIALVFVNAGAIVMKPLVDAAPADWAWLLGINVIGTANAVQAFLPGLLAQEDRSRLVVTSSVAALRAPRVEGQTLYMASKAAQLGLCNGLRAELEGTNVDLSVLFPGAVISRLRAKSEELRPGSLQVAMAPPGSRPGYLEPAEAGERILRGIERGQDFITTHPDERDKVRAFQDAVIAAFDA